MPAHTSKDLTGWGRYPVHRCHVARPEAQASVTRLLQQGDQATYIPRGLGRSYGDAALNEDGGIIDKTRLDRLLAFDAEEGLLRVEAGVPFSDLLAVCLPRGWFPAVTPGTQHVTVGGALAANVHGKNHHTDGAIADHVEQITLATPARGVVTCSPTEDPELFWATLGGMGLTGAILTATLRLRPVTSAYIHMDRRQTRDLDGTLDTLATTDASTYSVAWIDALAPGSSRGRGIVVSGDHATGEQALEVTKAPLDPPSRASRRLPMTPASWVLSRQTARVFNAIYHQAHGPRQGELVDLDRFFYPLDALDGWNRVYGDRGFLQHQAVLPKTTGREAVQAQLEHVAESSIGAYLAVLKRMGPADPGPLSFPMAGYTLALDLPREPGSETVARDLAELTADQGGRVYLAKDAVLDHELLEAMYPETDRFRQVKDRVDPDQRLASSLSDRVGLTGEAGR